MPMLEKLKQLRTKLEHRKGQRDQLQSMIDQLGGHLDSLQKDIVRHERALEIAKHVGLATQKQLEFHLAEQVSLAMSAVFDNAYQLKLNFQEKRGKTEVELLFVRGGVEFTPMGSAGGGAIDVASLALRMAYWVMRRDKKNRAVLLLDEPLSQLKGERANERALTMVQEIAHRLNLQIIMVSDERISRESIVERSDKVYQVVKKKGTACKVIVV